MKKHDGKEKEVGKNIISILHCRINTLYIMDIKEHGFINLFLLLNMYSTIQLIIVMDGKYKGINS